MEVFDPDNESAEADAEQAWKRARLCVIAGKRYDADAAQIGAEDDAFQQAMRKSVQICIDERIKEDAARKKQKLSDEELSRLCRFTDPLSLKFYSNFLHLVPRLVNVVTVCAFSSHSPLSRPFLHARLFAARRSHSRQRHRR